MLKTRWTNELQGNYWIVHQLISKGLHTGDNESIKYTTNLMDKLEKVSRAQQYNHFDSSDGV